MEDQGLHHQICPLFCLMPEFATLECRYRDRLFLLISFLLYCRSSRLFNSLKRSLMFQIVPAVTELIVAELLWLDYDNPAKPIYFYINSSGTQVNLILKNNLRLC